MTDETPTPTAPTSVETEAPATALVLTPPAAVPAVTQKQAELSTTVDDATAKQIDQAVAAFIESLVTMDVHSPDFQRKVESVSQMGNVEIRRSAEVSNRFLDRPAAARSSRTRSAPASWPRRWSRSARAPAAGRWR